MNDPISPASFHPTSFHLVSRPNLKVVTEVSLATKDASIQKCSRARSTTTEGDSTQNAFQCEFQ